MVTRSKLVFLLVALIIACNLYSQKKTNIILILADDMGYGDLGCYGQGKIKTPNIDKLASEGIRFTNFYAGGTVCAPSRAALLTGLHNGHNSVRGNQPFPQMLGTESTIASELKKQGYATAVIGKWGIGHPQPIGDPLRCGFDYSLGYLNMWHAHNFYAEFLYENGNKIVMPGNKLLPKEKWSNNSWVGKKEDAPEGYGEADIKATYIPDVMEKRVLNYITENKEKPFFVYYSTTIPHSNNEIKKNGMEVPDWGIYKNEDWPDVEKGFAAAISRLDVTVGKIVSHLKKEGLDKNTLIIFTSDNGSHSEGGHSATYFKSSGIYRGKKRDLYEGGIRIPMIAYWPSKIVPSVNNKAFAQYDFFKTFMDVTRNMADVKTDGLSLLPTFLGKEKKQKYHSYLYWEFYEDGGRQAVLQYPWKLIKFNTTTFTTNGKWELYNISIDPSETNNLAEKNAEKVKALSELMKQAHKPHPSLSIDSPREGQAGKT